MFLRCHTRQKDGKLHRFWSIVETRRCGKRGTAQRPVLYLGEINDSQQAAWRKTIAVLEDGAAAPRSIALFPDDQPAPLADDAVVRIRLAALTIRRPRQWGACWLACHLWTELGLDAFWAERLGPNRKGTRWDWILAALTSSRLLDPGSEWRLHRDWYARSALPDLLGAGDELVEIHKLYRCLDQGLPHKRALFAHLTARWRDLFNCTDEVLRSDLTSTAFASDPPDDPTDKRRFGYSRDKRGDCVQLVIALIITPEGFPLAYEVLAGNTTDNRTLRLFLRQIERRDRHGRADLAHGSRHPDRSDARPDAREHPAGPVRGRHAEGPADHAGSRTRGSTLAAGAGRDHRDAPAPGGRRLRPGPERGPRRERAGDAAQAAQAPLAAAPPAPGDGPRP